MYLKSIRESIELLRESIEGRSFAKGYDAKIEKENGSKRPKQ